MKVKHVLITAVSIFIFSMMSCSNEDPCDKWAHHRGAPTKQMIEDCGLDE